MLHPGAHSEWLVIECKIQVHFVLSLRRAIEVLIISQEFQLKLQIPVSYFLHVDLHVRKML